MLALAGAAIVLWPETEGARRDVARQLPLPGSLADWLGLVGGFSFALNNVMLRREAARPEEGRALAMFLGGALVAGVARRAARGERRRCAGRHRWRPRGCWPVAGLTVLFLAGNLALQYGAARLAANLTAVVMLTEVVFASASAHRARRRHADGARRPRRRADRRQRPARRARAAPSATEGRGATIDAFGSTTRTTMAGKAQSIYDFEAHVDRRQAGRSSRPSAARCC